MRPIKEGQFTEGAPGKEGVTAAMERVVVTSAVSAYLVMRDLSISLPERERVKLVDDAAAGAMGRALNSLPFSVLSVGSEGEKEKVKDGLEVGIVLGKFGETKEDSLWIVNDPVEGTSAAANKRPGAISILAGSEPAGLLQTPQGVHYMDKLIAPPGLSGKVSLDNDPRENLQAVKEYFEVSEDRILPVILNRPRNQELIDKVKAFGSEPLLIEAGDLTPSLAAIVNPLRPNWDPKRDKVILVMGIGGFEEGVIAAAAARAMGGVAQGRIWHQNENLLEQHNDLLDTDDLAPGNPNSTFVTFAPITDEPWFNKKGVNVEKRAKNLRIRASHVTIASSGERSKTVEANVPFI